MWGCAKIGVKVRGGVRVWDKVGGRAGASVRIRVRAIVWIEVNGWVII